MKKIYYAFLVLFLVCSSANIVVACEDNSNGNTNTEPPSQNVVYSNDVIISEVLPNPSTDESADEFIELYNQSTTAVDLTGWLLSDATTKTYMLSGTISAQHHLVVYRSDTGIALNNGGDSVELYHPDGVLTDAVEYDASAADDVSYALNNKDKWLWTTTPTPARTNIITTIDEETENNSDTTEQSEDDLTDEDNDDSDNSDAPYQLSDYIQLSELLPDPSGSDATDEWIELVNTGTQPVDIYGWEVTVGDDSYLLKEVTQIASNSYLLLPVTETNLSLNNSGETVTLIDPMGEAMDSVTYVDAPTGQSYSNSVGGWQWTVTLTPGEVNVISAPSSTEAAAEDDTTATDSSTSTTSVEEDAGAAESTTTISIFDAKALDSGQEVIVQGIVSVIPGVYSTTYFYMQDETSGIQIYSSSKAFPALVIGDVIQVTANTSTSNGEERLVVENIDDIVVVSQGAQLTPQAVVVPASEQYGQLVTVTGTVTTVSGSTIQLDTNWEIYLKRGTEISASSFTEGSVTTVIGVLIGTDDGVQVWPRAATDVVLDATIASATTEGIAGTGNATQLNNTDMQTTTGQDFTVGDDADAESNQSKAYWPWLALGGIVSLTLGLRAAWLNTRIRNWCVAQGGVWVDRFCHSVGLRKNTKDSNDLSQYHGSHLSQKTPV